MHSSALCTLSITRKHQLRLTFVLPFTCSTNATFQDLLFIRATYGSSLFHLPSSSHSDPAGRAEYLKAYFCNLYYKKIGVPNRGFQGHMPLPSPVSPCPSLHTTFSCPRITYRTRKEHFTAEKGSKRSQRSTYCLLKEFHLQSLEQCPHRGSAPQCWLLTTGSTLATE